MLVYLLTVKTDSLRPCDAWFCRCGLWHGDQLRQLLSLSQVLVLRLHVWSENPSPKTRKSSRHLCKEFPSLEFYRLISHEVSESLKCVFVCFNLFHFSDVFLGGGARIIAVLWRSASSSEAKVFTMYYPSDWKWRATIPTSKSLLDGWAERTN